MCASIVCCCNHKQCGPDFVVFSGPRALFPQRFWRPVLPHDFFSLKWLTGQVRCLPNIATHLNVSGAGYYRVSFSAVRRAILLSICRMTLIRRVQSLEYIAGRVVPAAGSSTAAFLIFFPASAYAWFIAPDLGSRANDLFGWHGFPAHKVP